MPEPRPLTVRQVAVLLLTFALVAVALDARGLLGWARRMDVGPAQDAWLAALEPLDAATTDLGLAAPREHLVAFGEYLQRSGDDSTLTTVAWDAPATPSNPVQAARVGPLNSDTPTADATISNATSDTSGPEASDASHAAVPLPDAGPTDAPRGPLEVLLIGDSLMGVGITPALTRLAATRTDLALIPAHRNASGLARPDNYDWPATLDSLLEKYAPDVVVCALGGNDVQHFRHEGETYRFGTDAWDEVYKQRLRALFTKATARAKLLVVGLPVMRESDFDADIRRLNGLVASVVADFPGVGLLDVNPVLANGDGAFTTWLPDGDGKLVRIRTEDGIHYAGAGGGRVAALVLAWLDAQPR
jgi:hypothetical protein